MKLSDITPVILTYNEEANIGRTLEALRWAPVIVVVDSGSRDGTCELCRSHHSVQWVERAFDSHANQWNFAVSLAPTDWVLSLDADYLITDLLREEFAELDVTDSITAYAVPFRFAVNGKILRAHILPPRLALFNRKNAQYLQDGHTQRLYVQSGKIGDLKNPIIHDDRKSFARWWSSQIRYAALEVEKLTTTAWSDLTIQDRLRRCILPAPPLVFVYTLFIKLLILDGPAGWWYCLQRTLAETLLSSMLARKLFLKN